MKDSEIKCNGMILGSGEELSMFTSSTGFQGLVLLSPRKAQQETIQPR
jgi:hypothetical protein